MAKKISVIIPVFNEELNLRQLYDEIFAAIKGLEYEFEIIFIDDGSSDDSYNALKLIAYQDDRIKVLSFTKNFGHQNALLAGYKQCTGDAAITLDSDLQHPPHLIPEFISKWEEGNLIINALRNDTRGAGRLKKGLSKAFYNLMSFLSDVKIPIGSSDFRLIDRRIIETILQMDNDNLFFRGIINWTGYKSCNINYIANRRFSGRTKYTTRKMIKFALTGITSFSIIPLRLTTFLGIIITFLSFIYILIALYENLINKATIEGWTSVLISILFLGGIQLLFMGILGEYIGRIFSILKKRPQYIIGRKIE